VTGTSRPDSGRDVGGELDVALVGVSAELERYAASATPDVPDGLVQRILEAVASEPAYSPVGRLLAAMAPAGWPGLPAALVGLFRAVAGRPRPIRMALRIEAAALLVVLACVVTGTGGLAVLAVRGMAPGPGPVTASPPGLVSATPPVSSQPVIMPAPTEMPAASPTPAASRARPSVAVPLRTARPPAGSDGKPGPVPPSSAPASPRPESSAPVSPAASPDGSGEPADGGSEPVASGEVGAGSSPSH
jgi:hypothetical protein